MRYGILTESPLRILHGPTKKTELRPVQDEVRFSLVWCGRQGLNLHVVDTGS